MSRFQSYLNTACRLIDSYHSGKPFSHHLKFFFSQEKKYGSRDRKFIASLCYQYFRVAHLLKKDSGLEQKIIAAVFLCESNKSDLLEFVRPELNASIHHSPEDKIQSLGLDLKDIFPQSDALSREVSSDSFFMSFLKQPGFFVRVRPGKKEYVCKKLDDLEIAYSPLSDCSLLLREHISLDSIFKLNGDLVVQDLSSQMIFDELKLTEMGKQQNPVEVWDCCAASGGKSILLHDLLSGNLKLTVSDIRKNILSNLKERLSDAKVPFHNIFLQNLSISSGLPPQKKFDIVVCDVPCTGSGTWSRNPEQLYSFNRDSINEFVLRQQAIVSNVLPHVVSGGLFIYVTCSVFEQENEQMASFITQQANLTIIHMGYVKGYLNDADTMFVAAFKN